MRFQETTIPGAFVLDPARHEDERGFFARTWCRHEFELHGIGRDWVQCSISFNKRRGTLRGLHWQAAPWEEAKLIRCTAGAIYDVIVDLRRDSPHFGRWLAVQLTATNRQILFVPEGFAHGFQTLMDDSEVSYQMSCEYHPESARGLRWNDPAFAIVWPDCNERIISARDDAFPEFVLGAGSYKACSTY
jgi:dTDP-4-dehydrorhamnose 3,5-epimerase